MRPGPGVLVLSVALVGACGRPSQPPASAVLSRTALVGTSSLSGVSLEPSTGKRFLLDGRRILEVGAAAPVYELPATAPEFFDVAALGRGQFALIARNDGYVLDVGAKTLQRRFCYLPDSTIDIDPQATQLSQVVTFEPKAARLYAQPQTFFSNRGGEPSMSQIGTFDPVTGADLNWFNLPDPEYLATGMAVENDTSVFLADGSTLRRFDLQRAQWGQSFDLSSLGIGRVEGLALDTKNDALVVLDAEDAELVELAVTALR